ncbi:tetraacyldisaccharide 4'-kinase [Algibacter sp. AS12]|uniref:tetraacyldisaccharide 4'-kinase n=1 Tax=Algibacter sp. AS12 TaxID=3135773 RepID=UPI00398AC8CB
MNIIRKLLFPVIPIYFMVTWLRNKLYDLGIKKSKSYKLPIICVGNLSAGGTGKTPMIEYLIRLLKDDFKVATLSRGYKRKTEGFQLANITATADTIGDEPFQFYTKFKDSILVAVDADRQHGIEILQNEKPDVILLDDAYQHRKVSAGFNVLLSTYANPFFKDIVLPTGNLREPRGGSKRADVIIVTKCPKGLNSSEKSNIVKRISPETHQHVFFSTIDYAKSVIAAGKTEYIENLAPFTLVTGIANAKPLLNYLNEKNLKFEHLNFKDHYNFTLNDIENLAQKEVIVTTEKDYMRLKQYDSLKEKLFYLPIAVNIDDADKLNTLIKAFVKH